MACISLKSALVATLAAVATAMPAVPRLSDRQLKIHQAIRRQEAAGAAAGITDPDILQFALTLEWLETTFYQQGLQQVPQQQFLDLGLTQQQVADLAQQGKEEETHVQLLQGALAQKGVQPVQPCQYNFGQSFSSASAMLQTAVTLEQVGVSAYLGAAPLIQDKSILGTAASIYSIEARHQTFTRVATKAAASPNSFDTPLTPKQVFSLAAPFIASCPQGSNLALTAFPNITMTNPEVTAQIAVASPQMLQLQSAGATGAAACAFSSGDLPTGTMFTQFANGACPTPQGLTGVVYVNLVNAMPMDSKITDDIIAAGPMVLVLS